MALLLGNHLPAAEFRYSEVTESWHPSFCGRWLAEYIAVKHHVGGLDVRSDNVRAPCAPGTSGELCYFTVASEALEVISGAEKKQSKLKPLTLVSAAINLPHPHATADLYYTARLRSGPALAFRPLATRSPTPSRPLTAPH